MTTNSRFCLDRRSGEDRRKAHSLEYFLKGGIERRSRNERRHQDEKRKDWVRISKWSSLPTKALTAEFRLDDNESDMVKDFCIETCLIVKEHMRGSGQALLSLLSLPLCNEKIPQFLST